MRDETYSKVAILGAGSWGSALAFLLAGKGVPVTLWDRDPELTAAITERGVNPRYLPDITLGETVTATAQMKDALADADWAIVAVASDGVRAVVSEAASALEAQTGVISAVKGLEAQTGLTVSEVIATLLADTAHAGVAVLSGPNLSGELVRGVPSASVVACADPALARRAQTLLMTGHTLRVYTHSDVTGVELGGALKNVLAIGAGISDGLGFGDNTKSAFLTRGLMEMTQLGVAAGGKALTFLGLSGVGDLIATASSRLSRNYRVGLGLAERRPLDEILTGLRQAAEGVPTARAALVLSRRYGVSTPVFTSLHEVLFHAKSPALAVQELMERTAKDEFAF